MPSFKSIVGIALSRRKKSPIGLFKMPDPIHLDVSFVGTNQVGRSDANPHLVDIGVIHKKTADGSARVSNGYRRSVGDGV